MKKKNWVGFLEATERVHFFKERELENVLSVKKRT